MSPSSASTSKVQSFISLITVIRIISQDCRSTVTEPGGFHILCTLLIRCGAYSPSVFHCSPSNPMAEAHSSDANRDVSLVRALAGTSLIDLNRNILALVKKPYPELELSVSGT